MRRWFFGGGSAMPYGEKPGMEPLDLTKGPPRSARQQLGGLLMLARTIDKLRASLPGGQLGVYHIKGFSQTLLDELGITEEELRDVVARSKTDEDVLAWVEEHSDPSDYERINRELTKTTIGDRLDRPAFVEKYPIIKTLPPQMSLLEMVEVDDRDMFPSAAAAQTKPDW